MAKLSNTPTGGETLFTGDQALRLQLVCGACDTVVDRRGNVAYGYGDSEASPVDFDVFHDDCGDSVDKAKYPRSRTVEGFVTELARLHLSRSILEGLASEALDRP